MKKKTLDPYYVCKSCGEDFTKHKGVMGTCKALQEARKEIRRLKRKIKDQQDAIDEVLG